MDASRNLFVRRYVVLFEAVLQISAVVAIGWAEGLSHVNLRKVYIITWWWIGSLVPICLITAALMAQGMAMARWGVCVCVCLSASLQRSAQQPHMTETQLQTAQKPPVIPSRTAHWLCITLFGLVHDTAKQCISLSP